MNIAVVGEAVTGIKNIWHHFKKIKVNTKQYTEIIAHQHAWEIQAP